MTTLSGNADRKGKEKDDSGRFAYWNEMSMVHHKQHE